MRPRMTSLDRMRLMPGRRFGLTCSRSFTRSRSGALTTKRASACTHQRHTVLCNAENEHGRYDGT